MDYRHRLWIHQEVLQPDPSWATPPVQRRLSLVLRHLSLKGVTSVVKFVHGAGKGWRRTPLGGSHGCHYYLWWAPAGTPPVSGWKSLERGDVVVRAVRHHDETDLPIAAGGESDFACLTPPEVRDPSYFGEVLNDAQRRFADARAPVRILVGHPGTGKTTALWEAAATLPGERILYLANGDALASEASRHFEQTAQDGGRVSVMMFVGLLEMLAPDDTLGEQPGWSHAQAPSVLWAILRDEWLWQGRLGLWERMPYELYGELYGIFYGRALPVEFRNLDPASGAGMRPASYRRFRRRSLPDDAIDMVCKVGTRLEAEGLLDRVFPRHVAARRAVGAVRSGQGLPPSLRVSGILVDEVQDLTLLEQFLVVALLQAVEEQTGSRPALMVSGDEGQTVIPSGFEWGTFSDLAAEYVGRPEKHDLVGNVRSPRPIVEVINRTWELYGSLSKAERPRGYARAGFAGASSGRVLYAASASDEETESVFNQFVDVPGRRIIYPASTVAGWQNLMPINPAVSTSAREKGLDYQTVVVWNAGHLMELLKRLPSEKKYELHEARVTIDSLRVAVSRATETLIFVDVKPGIGAMAAVRDLCRNIPEFAEVGMPELLRSLEEEHLDAEETVHLFCEEARLLVGRDNERAYRQAGLAVAALGRSGADTAVHDAALRRQAQRTLGLSAFHLYLSQPTPAADANLLDQAIQAFQAADETASASALQQYSVARAQRGRPHLSAPAVRALCATLPRVDEDLQAPLRGEIMKWSRQVIANPADIRTWELETCVHTLETITDILGEEARIHLDSARRSLGHGLMEDLRFPEALEVWRNLGETARPEEAACLEGLQRFREAGEAFEQADLPADALRCYRKAPAPVEARRLAERLKDPSLKSLQWILDLESVVENGARTAELTEAERRHVASLLKDVGILPGSGRESAGDASEGRDRRHRISRARGTAR